MEHRLNRRTFLRGASSLVAVGMLAACVPGAVPSQTTEGETTTGDAPAQAGAKVTVFWRSNPKEIETMEEAFAAFEEQNPGTSVEFVTVSGGAEGESKLQALFAAGTAPEVYASVFQAGLVDYVYRDLAMNLTPYIERDSLDQSDFFPLALETFTFGGNQYGIPRGGVPVCIFYNKSLFDEAGVAYPPTDWEDESWTWDEMVNRAKALTKDSDGDGRIDQYGILFPNINFNQFPMLWDQDIFPPEVFAQGIAQSHNFDDPTVVTSFQRGADLIWQEEVAPTPAVGEALAGAVGGAVGSFLSGRIGMFVQLANYAAVNDANFEWSVAALPRGSADLQQRSMTFTGPFLIGTGSANPEGGWELIKYLTSDEGQRFIARGAVVGTSRQSLTEWWLGQFSAPLEDMLAIQNGGYEHGTESPNVRTVSWPRITDLVNAEFDGVWLGERSAEEAAQAVAQPLTDLMNEIYSSQQDAYQRLYGG